MRNWFWATVIALALAAIVAGYFEGTSNAHPPATVQLHPHGAREGPPKTATLPHGWQHLATDASVNDLFSQDDVVVDRQSAASPDWQPERLSIVVGLCGQSLAAESGFLRLGLPISIDLDPNAADAARVAEVVRSNGERLYVHVSAPPSAAVLRRLRERIGAFDGIAARVSTGMPTALAGTALAFFDERGDAKLAAFREEGIDVARRSVTADDRASGSYVAFMLERAAIGSTRQGRTVVLLRPLPTSLAALTEFVHSGGADISGLR